MLLPATCMTLILTADFLTLWGLYESGIANLFFLLLLLILIHLSLCVLVIRLLMLFLPIREGEFPSKSHEASRWRAQAVVGLLSYIYFEPFVPFFLRSTWYRLFGAKIAKGAEIGGKIVDCSLIELKEGAGVGHDSLILGHWIVGDRCKIGKVVIGKKAMIGAKSLIFPGAVINDGAAIGAMSLLTSDQKIPANELWVGIPAKKIQKKSVQVNKESK